MCRVNDPEDDPRDAGVAVGVWLAICFHVVRFLLPYLLLMCATLATTPAI